MGLNRNCPSPGVRTRGESTRKVHSVETSPGMATSLVPRKAASRGVTPIPRCRWVFSRQMMALSIMGPIASVMPARVIVLIVWPVK